jgi:hypothetical protein
MRRELSVRTTRETGGVLVELSFVVVTLMFLIGAVLSVGRLINQMAWFSQTTYNAVLEGSTKSADTRDADMLARAQQLWNGTHALVDSSNGMTLNLASSSAVTASTAGAVQFKLAGTLSRIFGQSVEIPVSMNIQASVLTGNTASAGNPNFFAPSLLQYNCDGVPCGGGGGQPACPTSPCPSCTWDTGLRSYTCQCAGFSGDYSMCINGPFSVP